MTAALFNHFEAKQGHTFSIQLDEGVSLQTQLVEVRALRRVASITAQSDHMPFSLLFKGPVQPLLPQSTYRLQHAADDQPLDVFMVPVSADATGVHYEAVFS